MESTINFHLTKRMLLRIVFDLWRHNLKVSKTELALQAGFCAVFLAFIWLKQLGPIEALAAFLICFGVILLRDFCFASLLYVFWKGCRPILGKSTAARLNDSGVHISADGFEKSLAWERATERFQADWFLMIGWRDDHFALTIPNIQMDSAANAIVDKRLDGLPKIVPRS